MLFVGDDWAEDHHDVELVDDQGRVLVRRRLPVGLGGVTRLHALVAEHSPPQWADLDPAEAAAQVVVGIETDRGPWVGALIAAGYTVYALNPMSVARYRERHSTSGAKSDTADAHLLAEIVRLDRAHHRQVAGDSATGEAIKVSARAHQGLIWDRTRHVLRPCARRCGTSSPPPWLRSANWTSRTPWRCWPRRRTRTAPRGCPGPRSCGR